MVLETANQWGLSKAAGLVVSSLKRGLLVRRLRTFYFFSSRDLKCGKIFCAGGQRSSLLGENKAYSLTNQKQNVTIKCKTMFLNHNSRDMGLVNSGTKCGDGMVRGEDSCSQTSWRLGLTPDGFLCGRMEKNNGHVSCFLFKERVVIIW